MACVQCTATTARPPRRFHEAETPPRRGTREVDLPILLVLVFGGYYRYSRWGAGAGLGIVGTVALVVVIVYLVGGLR